MKKIFLIVPCLLFWLAVHNVSAAPPDGKRQLVSCISNTEMNIMYRDYDNKFRVMVQGVPYEKIKVQAESAMVRKEDGLWIITPTTDRRNITVEVFADINGQIREAGTYQFRVKPLPQPMAYLLSDGKEIASGEYVTKKLLMKENTVLEVSFGSDGILNVPLKILGFDMLYEDYIIHSDSNHFSDAQQAKFFHLKAGDKITIQSIRAVDSNGRKVFLSPLVFTVR